MLSFDSKDARISKITLAFMEDSGWYKPDYSMAEIPSWGLNNGCEFL